MLLTQALPRNYHLVNPLPNLRGGYGFLTDFGALDESEARDRIDRMFHLYGIREFQFYDWFAGYALPTLPSGLWQNAWNHTYNIYANTIRTYVDEIHRLGGRAWAYVQSVGAAEYGLADDSLGIFELIDGSGEQLVWDRSNNNPVFPCYFLNAAWADHQCQIWAPAARNMQFDGIHWDTLGARAADYEAEAAGTHEFLRRAKQHLSAFGLQQTLNFSGHDGQDKELAWWDPTLVIDGTIAFPYFEVYASNDESRCYSAMADLAVVKPVPPWGVMAYYPMYGIPLEWVQEDPSDAESQTFLARWFFGPHNRIEYLGVGDGDRRLHDQYFPGAVELTLIEQSSLILEPPFAAPPKVSLI